MTYWVLPKSGIPISTDTVQAVTQAELQTDVVKEQIEKWKEGTKRFLEAKTTDVTWKEEDEVHPSKIFDLEEEDDEFLRNFSMPVNELEQRLAPIQEGTEEEEQETDPRRQGTVEGDLQAPTYVGMEVGLCRGNDGEILRARVKRQAVGEEGLPIGTAHKNPLVDTRQYEVEYDDGTTETLAMNLLAENILAQVDEFGHKHRMLEEIGGHRKTDDAIKENDSWFTTRSGCRRRRKTTKGWELYIIWKDGSSNWIPLSEMKESYPIETAEYAVEHSLQSEPAFIWWISHVLNKRNRILSKVKSKYWERTHKYGIRLPHSIQEALEIDRENGNTMWEDAIKMEMENNRVAFEEYNGDVKNLVGYKKITGHMVFDIKLSEGF